MMTEFDGTQNSNTPGSAAEKPASSSRLYLYILPLVVVPLLLLAVAIFVVPSDWLAERSGNPFLVTLGYGAMLHNADCQIVIYGDSTAMIGITPALVHERTGLTTCNIAETEGMTMVNGTMVLDQFLAQNARPRYIIFMYSPEGMDPKTQRHNPEVTTFEAVTYLFRQPDKLASLLSVMHRPDDFFSWAEHGDRMAMSAIFAKPFPPSVRQQRFKTNGQSTLRNPPLTSCSYARHNTPPDKAWVNALRTKYATESTTVFVDAVLLPECDPDIAYFREHLAGVIDNRIDTLPPGDFYGGGRHVNPAGTVPLSYMIADQVNQSLHSTTTTGAN